MLHEGRLLPVRSNACSRHPATPRHIFPIPINSSAPVLFRRQGRNSVQGLVPGTVLFSHRGRKPLSRPCPAFSSPAVLGEKSFWRSAFWCLELVEHSNPSLSCIRRSRDLRGRQRFRSAERIESPRVAIPTGPLVARSGCETPARDPPRKPDPNSLFG